MAGKDIHIEEDYKQIDFFILKRLLKFLKKYSWWTFLAILLTLLVSALGPIRPYLTKVAIDDYISRQDVSGLIRITAIIFTLLLAHGILQFVLTYIMQKVGQKVLYDIRIMLHKHLLSLSLRFYDKNPVGRLVTRVTNDVEALNELFSSGVVMIIADLLLLIWIIGFMFFISWQLALITLTILPLLIIVSFIFRIKIRSTFREIRKSISEINSFLNEFITGIATVKLFARENTLNERFDKLNRRQLDLQIKTILYYALFFPVVEMLSAIALGLVLWYTAGNILSGYMTVGILIAFTQYAEMFFRPIRDLTEKYTTLQSAMASAERIFGLLDNNDIIQDAEKAVNLRSFSDKIEFKNLNFSYEDAKPVLKNVSFVIRKGETVAIVGATGSGKTTIINLLCRFYDYRDGSILIDGIDLRNLNQDSIRAKMALVMQDVFMFSRTVSENISLGSNGISTDEIKQAAIELGAYDFINNLPMSFNEKITERAQTISAGQRQLLAFCRAYVNKPEILILDEATSNIDTETELIIEKALEKLLAGRTSIIIAHRLSTIRRADKIIVLHHGEIREIGSHEELMKMNGIYSRLYQLQKF